MAQECQSLRSETNKSKVKSSAPLLNVPTTPPSRSYASLQNGPLSPPRPKTAAPTSPPSSDPRSRATSPTSPTPYSHAPSVHSPLASRVAAAHLLHTRSASVQPTSISHRSITPAIRSGTPASPVRPELRSRRMSVSTPSPLKMVRSTSSGSSADEIQIQKDSHRERERESERQRAEKDAKRVQLIQRWIPNFEASSPPTGMLGTHFIPPSAPRSPPPLVRSRTTSAAQAASRLATPLRYKTPVSANPS